MSYEKYLELQEAVEKSKLDFMDYKYKVGRVCPMCKEYKTADEFSSTNTYCRTCFNERRNSVRRRYKTN